MTELKVIAHIHNDYKEKFGIPRQSGLVSKVKSRIVFTKEYRDETSLRGMEDYSHLWLIWIFSKADTKGKFSPTVRPPRLGGNKRMGVFATRSPFRPNSLGLSSVKFVEIQKDPVDGPVIIVEGADLLDGTPIVDIKPYLPFTDIHNDAKGGFAEEKFDYHLDIQYTCDTKNISDDIIDTITETLMQDPRPSYQEDPERIYGMVLGEYEIKFKVDKKICYVISIERDLK